MSEIEEIRKRFDEMLPRYPKKGGEAYAYKNWRMRTMEEMETVLAEIGRLRQEGVRGGGCSNLFCRAEKLQAEGRVKELEEGRTLEAQRGDHWIAECKKLREGIERWKRLERGDGEVDYAVDKELCGLVEEGGDRG